MAPTIKDVAKLAGVAQSTVSLVLNDRSNVAPATRQKILDAIDELEFHPRHTARHLALDKGGSIGFILTEQFFSVSEPFYTRILIGAEFEAAKRGYYTLLGIAHEPFNPKKDIPRFLLDGSADGIIVAGRAPEGLLRYIKNKGIPTVLVDYKIPFFNTNHVLINNLDGGKEAVRFLAAQGHTKIGFIGGSSNHPSIRERFEGYEEVLSEVVKNNNKSLKKWTYLVEDESSPLIGYEGALKILSTDDPPTAIFAVNDATAAGCFKAIKQKGLKIPGDIAVIGFDDVESGLHLDPDLSTVHIYKAEMGMEAVKTLVEQISDAKRPFQTKVISTKLVIRGSTGGQRTEEIDNIE